MKLILSFYVILFHDRSVLNKKGVYSIPQALWKQIEDGIKNMNRDDQKDMSSTHNNNAFWSYLLWHRNTTATFRNNNTTNTHNNNQVYRGDDDVAIDSIKWDYKEKVLSEFLISDAMYEVLQLCVGGTNTFFTLSYLHDSKQLGTSSTTGSTVTEQTQQQRTESLTAETGTGSLPNVKFCNLGIIQPLSKNTTGTITKNSFGYFSFYWFLPLLICQVAYSAYSKSKSNNNRTSNYMNSMSRRWYANSKDMYFTQAKEKLYNINKKTYILTTTLKVLFKKLFFIALNRKLK